MPIKEIMGLSFRTKLFNGSSQDTAGKYASPRRINAPRRREDNRASHPVYVPHC